MNVINVLNVGNVRNECAKCDECGFLQPATWNLPPATYLSI
jgi:hypothetical protein